MSNLTRQNYTNTLQEGKVISVVVDVLPDRTSEQVVDNANIGAIVQANCLLNKPNLASDS